MKVFIEKIKDNEFEASLCSVHNGLPAKVLFSARGVSEKDAFIFLNFQITAKKNAEVDKYDTMLDVLYKYGLDKDGAA